VSKGRKQRRGLRRRERGIFIGVWVPEAVVAAVDKAARSLHLNRSSFLRSALEDKVTRKGR
jgi:predicted transcriptional regulator